MSVHIELVNTADAVTLLNVSERTLKRWRSDVPLQGPPPIRIGSRIMYATADINTYLLEQRRKGR